MDRVKKFGEFAAITNDKMTHEPITELIHFPVVNKPGLDNFCRTLAKIISAINLDPIFDIFGEIYHDPYHKTSKPYIRLLNAGNSHDDAASAFVSGTLSYDTNGDWVSFVNKPTNAQFDRAKDYIEKTIKKSLGSDKKLWDSYGANLTVEIEGYNGYYQPRNTYAIRFTISFMPETKKSIWDAITKDKYKVYDKFVDFIKNYYSPNNDSFAYQIEDYVNSMLMDMFTKLDKDFSKFIGI